MPIPKPRVQGAGESANRACSQLSPVPILIPLSKKPVIIQHLLLGFQNLVAIISLFILFKVPSLLF